MWYTKEEREIAIAEYIQGNEMVRHYDTVSWIVGSIFIPISIGLLGLSYTEPVLEYGSGAAVALFFSSFSVYAIWLLIDGRYSGYIKVIFSRLHEIEKKYGMDQHLRINRIDSSRPLKTIARARIWIRALSVLLFVAWLIRIFWNF